VRNQEVDRLISLGEVKLVKRSVERLISFLGAFHRRIDHVLSEEVKNETKS